jgi:hypothetical protein
VAPGGAATEADVAEAVSDWIKRLKGGVLMPGFDRTGPLGEGPRTGRGLGKCGKAKATPRSQVGQGSRTRLGDRMAPGRGGGRGGGQGRTGGRGRGRM